jgi:hypothetical protein
MFYIHSPQPVSFPPFFRLHFSAHLASSLLHFRPHLAKIRHRGDHTERIHKKSPSFLHIFSDATSSSSSASYLFSTLMLSKVCLPARRFTHYHHCFDLHSLPVILSSLSIYLTSPNFNISHNLHFPSSIISSHSQHKPTITSVTTLHPHQNWPPSEIRSLRRHDAVASPPRVTFDCDGGLLHSSLCPALLSQAQPTTAADTRHRACATSYLLRGQH